MLAFALRSALFIAIALDKGLLLLPRFASYRPVIGPYAAQVSNNENAVLSMIATFEVYAGFYSILMVIL